MTPANRHRASSPCPHKSGSPERIETMRLRSLLGLPLRMPGDNVEQVPITHDGHKCSDLNPKIYKDPR